MPSQCSINYSVTKVSDFKNEIIIQKYYNDTFISSGLLSEYGTGLFFLPNSGFITNGNTGVNRIGDIQNTWYKITFQKDPSIVDPLNNTNFFITSLFSQWGGATPIVEYVGEHSYYCEGVDYNQINSGFSNKYQGTETNSNLNTGNVIKVLYYDSINSLSPFKASGDLKISTIDTLYNSINLYFLSKFQEPYAVFANNYINIAYDLNNKTFSEFGLDLEPESVIECSQKDIDVFNLSVSTKNRKYFYATEYNKNNVNLTFSYSGHSGDLGKVYQTSYYPRNNYAAASGYYSGWLEFQAKYLKQNGLGFTLNIDEDSNASTYYQYPHSLFHNTLALCCSGDSYGYAKRLGNSQTYYDSNIGIPTGAYVSLSGSGVGIVGTGQLFGLLPWLDNTSLEVRNFSDRGVSQFMYIDYDNENFIANLTKDTGSKFYIGSLFFYESSWVFNFKLGYTYTSQYCDSCYGTVTDYIYSAKQPVLPYINGYFGTDSLLYAYDRVYLCHGIQDLLGRVGAFGVNAFDLNGNIISDFQSPISGVNTYYYLAMYSGNGQLYCSPKDYLGSINFFDNINNISRTNKAYIRFDKNGLLSGASFQSSIPNILPNQFQGIDISESGYVTVCDFSTLRSYDNQNNQINNSSSNGGNFHRIRYWKNGEFIICGVGNNRPNNAGWTTQTARGVYLYNAHNNNFSSSFNFIGTTANEATVNYSPIVSQNKNFAVSSIGVSDDGCRWNGIGVNLKHFLKYSFNGQSFPEWTTPNFTLQSYSYNYWEFISCIWIDEQERVYASLNLNSVINTLGSFTFNYLYSSPYYTCVLFRINPDGSIDENFIVYFETTYQNSLGSISSILKVNNVLIIVGNDLVAYRGKHANFPRFKIKGTCTISYENGELVNTKEYNQ